MHYKPVMFYSVGPWFEMFTVPEIFVALVSEFCHFLLLESRLVKNFFLESLIQISAVPVSLFHRHLKIIDCLSCLLVM